MSELWIMCLHLYFFLWCCGPKRAMASSFERFLDHTTTHLSLQNYSGRVTRSSQPPLPDNSQNSRLTFMAPAEIRAHNFSRPTAPQSLLRPRSLWGSAVTFIHVQNSVANSFMLQLNLWRFNTTVFKIKYKFYKASQSPAQCKLLGVHTKYKTQAFRSNYELNRSVYTLPSLHTYIHQGRLFSISFNL